MKNIFKQNSRFASLVDDISNEYPKNKVSKPMNNKNNKNNNTNNNKNNNTNTITASKNNLFKNNTQTKEEKPLIKELNLLSEEMFPTLGGGVSKNKEDIKNSYSNILKKESSVKKVEKNIDIIKPGFVKLKLNCKSRKIEVTEYIDYEKQKSDYEKTQEEGFAVLDRLVYLHELRTKKYIDNWGYDEWEKIFRFPNYDYYYFDRLDELYEEELEKELEKELNNKLEEEFDDYEDFIYE